MPNGSLQVYATIAGQSAPLSGVTVTVSDEGGNQLARVTTGEDGAAPEIALSAPDKALSLDEENTTARPYGVYLLSAVCPGWQSREIAGVQVFDGQ